MQAGRYTEIVAILRKQDVETDYRSYSEYVEIKRTRANVQHLGGTLTEENKEQFHTSQVKFTVHSYIDVNKEDRIKWEDQEYRILDLFKNKELTKNDIQIIAELINK
jgi:head-tail adaptor